MIPLPTDDDIAEFLLDAELAAAEIRAEFYRWYLDQWRLAFTLVRAFA